MTAHPRNHLSTSTLWVRPLRSLLIIWGTVSLGLGAVGPFGSFMGIGLFERTLYWGAIAGASILLAVVLRRAALMLVGRGRHPFLVDAIATPSMVVLFSPSLFYFNEVVFDRFEVPGDLPFSLLQTAAIVLVVTLILIAVREMFRLHGPGVKPVSWTPDKQIAAGEPQSALVARLPEELRGEVQLVSGADHYVEVRTNRGVGSVLLRFSDALRELGDHPGAKVHRSHWVADCAVAGVQRDGARWQVVLRCGEKIPVSKSQTAAVLARWGEVSG